MPTLNQAVDISHGSFKLTPQRLVHGLSGRYNWMEWCNKFNQCKTFDDLQLLVKVRIDKIPNIPHIFAGDKELETDTVDKQSMKYIPSDIPQRYLLHHPVKILPDGNYFCRSISHLVYGSQDHHVEIRCRIVIDSIINFRHYIDNEYLMRSATHTQKYCNIAEYYCNYSGVTNVRYCHQTLVGIESVLKDDIMRILKLKEHCGPWQFHSAVNVLKSKLFMVFPSEHIQFNVRVDLNRVFCPSGNDNENCKQFGLLWTSTCSKDGIVPDYNH